MSIQTQLRRGTGAENDAFTGAVGEVTIDTTLDELRVHDGSRLGGFNVPNFASIQKQTYSYGTAGGTVNALTLTTQENPSALVAGLTCTVEIASDNTGAATLAWGSLTATSIKKWSSGVKSDLDAGDLVTGMTCTFIYDGADFILMGGNGSLSINTVTRQVFTSSGTYSPSSGMLYCLAQVQAPGGGAAGPNNFSTDTIVSVSQAGGSGSYSEGIFDAGTIGASQAITIGAAGSGGSAGNPGSSGTAGGTTSLGSLISCPGGGAGIYGSNPGAGGGAPTGGSFQVNGIAGGASIALANGQLVYGVGGKGFLGNCGAQGVKGLTNRDSTASTGYGCGGNARVSTGTSAGHPGGPGIIIITEYRSV